MKNEAVSFQNVDIRSGFWYDRQELNRKTTIYNVYKRFDETGRMDAFRCDWKAGDPNEPHIFWDSDVAKWMESAAYILQKHADARLEEIVDRLVDDIEKNQDADGYFNIYFTVCKPEERFTHRTEHELYCAGHLFEAAVAYVEATGKDKFLKLMCKYADYIERIFKTEHSTPYYTPGHEEIELALVKLYHCTGEKRYLELSRWFVTERGKHDEHSYDNVNEKYAQDHAPVYDMDTAEGHAVRALYLYCAMADIAYEYQDEKMLAACRRIFDNIVNKRMYITGGVGASKQGEAFTIDYDLPNISAYAESCASIAMLFFTRRMLLCDPDARYADIAERVLYNGFLSSMSLDGKSFFYVNMQETNPALRRKNASLKDFPTRIPQSLRLEVFGCSCCPPNITRLNASLGDYLYTHTADILYVQQYMDSTAQFTVGDAEVAVAQHTVYPCDGEITLTASGLAGKKLAVRIPAWCRSYTLTADGKPAAYTMDKGYAVLPVQKDTVTLQIVFDMPVELIEANSLVGADAGKVAVQRGPVVYCAEAVDNGENMSTLYLNAASLEPAVEKADKWMTSLCVNGFKKQPGTALYQPYGTAAFTPVRIHMIPYFAFSNRGESEMKIWMQVK